VRILFLGIDGVLCTGDHLAALSQGAAVIPTEATRRLEPRLQRACTKISAPAVERLNSILVAMARGGKEVSVAISSTWRLDYSRKELDTILHARGMLPSVKVRDCTPHLRGEMAPEDYHRGAEIWRWLETVEPDLPLYNIVILDDGGDMGRLKRRLVQTTFKTGLLNEHVEQARGMYAGRG